MSKNSLSLPYPHYCGKGSMCHSVRISDLPLAASHSDKPNIFSDCTTSQMVSCDLPYLTSHTSASHNTFELFYSHLLPLLQSFETLCKYRFSSSLINPLLYTHCGIGSKFVCNRLISHLPYNYTIPLQKAIVGFLTHPDHPQIPHH